MKKNLGFFPRILNSELKCPKKWYFLFYECAIYRIKSKVAYLGQFFADLDEIWYKSRATKGDLTHQISSWSDEIWQRYGTWSVSQGRRGPSNEVSKMNLFMAGGHSFWPRKLIFGYVVALYIYPKSYYYLLMIKSWVWPRQGPKDDQSVPKYRVRLYRSELFAGESLRLNTFQFLFQHEKRGL